MYLTTGGNGTNRYDHSNHKHNSRKNAAQFLFAHTALPP
jgi:hypothetical protein